MRSNTCEDATLNSSLNQVDIYRKRKCNYSGKSRSRTLNIETGPCKGGSQLHRCGRVKSDKPQTTFNSKIAEAARQQQSAGNLWVESSWRWPLREEV